MGCDRHVRPGAACPFCGDTEVALVPVESSGKRAKMLKAIAFTSVVASACSSTVTLVYGAPGEPFDEPDSAPPVIPRPIPQRDAACPPADVGPVVGVAPSLGRGVCTDAMLVELREGVRSPALLREIAGYLPECGRCAFGPSLYRSDAGLMPLGALLSSLGSVVNSEACVALLVGRDDCALELGARALCEYESCASCGGEPTRLASCRQANGRICDAKARPECIDAVAHANEDVLERCMAPSSPDAFVKVARAFCGSPGTDGGGADSGPD